eukprot:5434461-Pleurochrysis_carterae.AAC.2
MAPCKAFRAACEGPRLRDVRQDYERALRRASDHLVDGAAGRARADVVQPGDSAANARPTEDG